VGVPGESFEDGVVFADQPEQAVLPRASGHGVEEGQIRVRRMFE
jgi:hypothetical protein